MYSGSTVLMLFTLDLGQSKSLSCFSFQIPRFIDVATLGADVRTGTIT